MDEVGRALELLPCLEDPSFVAFTWSSEPGQVPYPTYDPLVDRVRSSSVDPYEFLSGDPEGFLASEASFTADSFQEASEAQVLRYFALCGRRERFGDGYLAGQLEGGVVLAALRRLRDLRSGG